jgi:hypothetical protein
MGELITLDHHRRPRPALPPAAERIVAINGFQVGQTVAFTRGGRTRRAVITALLCPPGEPARARLMIAPGYAGAGLVTSARIDTLDAIDD